MDYTSTTLNNSAGTRASVSPATAVDTQNAASRSDQMERSVSSGASGVDRLVKSPSQDMEENSYYLYLSKNPVRFEPLTRVTTVFFDEVNRQVFTIRLNGLSVVVKGPTEKVMFSISIPDKGELKSIKFSLDLNILGVQRSPKSVDFVNCAVGSNSSEYSQTCKGKGTILSFYWITATEIVYVTDQGLEYYQVCSDKKNLKLLKTYSMTINWSICLSESSVILTSTGTLATALIPFHFKAGLITKLSKFEVDLPLSTRLPQPSLKQSDVTLANIYGSIYALVLRHNIPNAQTGSCSDIVMYRIPIVKDAPVRKTDGLRLDLCGHFTVNVVDNLIIVHHMTSKTSMIFDIRSESGVEIQDGVTYHRIFVSPLPIRPFRLKQPGLSSSGVAEVQECNCDLYSSGWVMFQPDIVVDAKLGCVWTLQLKLDSLVSMVTDKCMLVKFLLLRRNSKKVLLDLCRNLLSPGKQSDLSVIGSIYDSLNHVYSQHIDSEAAAGSTAAAAAVGGRDKQLPVIDQSDMYTHVFSVLEESNHKFVVAVIIEYIRSLGLYHITVQHFIVELVIRTLVHNKLYYQLHQFLQYHILTDSKQLAYSLLSLESSYPPAYQLALDMLKRLGTANDSILEVLLSKQLLLSTLRFAQSTGIVDQLPARKFLEVARATQNDQLYYIVFKFFEQRNIRLRASAQFQPGEHCETYVEHFKMLFGTEALG